MKTNYSYETDANRTNLNLFLKTHQQWSHWWRGVLALLQIPASFVFKEHRLRYIVFLWVPRPWWKDIYILVILLTQDRWLLKTHNIIMKLHVRDLLNPFRYHAEKAFVALRRDRQLTQQEVEYNLIFFQYYEQQLFLLWNSYSILGVDDIFFLCSSYSRCVKK